MEGGIRAVLLYIMHIAVDRNCWGGLLSRRVTVPSVSDRAFAVFAATGPDETLASKQAIRNTQQAPRANLGTLAVGTTSFMTNDGHVTLDDEGLFRLQVIGHAVRRIPGGANKLQVQLMVCALMKEADHRGAVATLQRLSESSCWFRMEEHVTEFIRQCVHSMYSKARERVPRPLWETVHGTRRGDVVHFDYMLERVGRWETMA